MMGEPSKVVVTIAGMEYTLRGEEPPEYIQRVAGLVDRKTREILRADPSLSVTQTAVLASINLGDEALRQHHAAEAHLRKARELEKRLETADEEAEALRQEITAARESMARMKKEMVRCEAENRALRERLHQMEARSGEPGGGSE